MDSSETRLRKSSAPRLGKALLLHQFASDFVLDHAHPVPAPGPNEVRIKTVAVGLNPVDWQAKDYKFGISSLPWVSGRDVAGVVSQVGEAITNFVPGDAVFTLTDYTSSRCGAFQEYCIASQASISLIPRGITFEEAAAIPVGAITAGVALQRYMGLHPSDRLRPHSNDDDWLPVWGGATCTGYFAVQLARIYGLRVLAVAGRSNMDYVYGAGAEVVLDRKEESGKLVDDIKRITDGRLKYALDAVGSTTAGLCLHAMNSGKASSKVLVALAGLPKETNATMLDSSSIRLENSSLVHAPEIKVKVFHNDPNFGAQLLTELSERLDRGQLRVPRIRVLQGGLEDVNKGLALLKQGQISGSKLVIRVDKTADYHGGLEYNGWL